MFKSIYCTRARSCEPGYVLRETKGGRNLSDLYSTVFQDNLSKVNSCVFNMWRLSLRFVKVRAEHDKPGCLFAGSICLSMCVHWQSITQSMCVHIAHACPTMFYITLVTIVNANWRIHQMREHGWCTGFFSLSHQPSASFSTWLFHALCFKLFKLWSIPQYPLPDIHCQTPSSLIC